MVAMTADTFAAKHGGKAESRWHLGFWDAGVWLGGLWLADNEFPDLGSN